jgi:hypothetical protein
LKDGSSLQRKWKLLATVHCEEGINVVEIKWKPFLAVAYVLEIK